MSKRKDWESSTFGERIFFLAELRTKGNLSELGRVCKPPFASGVMSRMSLRTEKSVGYSKTAKRFADAWGVSEEWMAHGHGEIEAPPKPVTDAELDRVLAVARARWPMVQETAWQRARAMFPHGHLALLPEALWHLATTSAGYGLGSLSERRERERVKKVGDDDDAKSSPQDVPAVPPKKKR